jgi:hypothetical protein
MVEELTVEEDYKNSFYPTSLIDTDQINIYVAEGGHASSIEIKADGFYAILYLVIEIVIEPDATLTTADLDSALAVEGRELNYEGTTEFDDDIDANDLSFAIMECDFYQNKGMEKN